MNQKNNNKKNESSLGGLLIAAVIIFSVLAEADAAALGILIFVAVIALGFYIYIAAAKRAKESGAGASVGAEEMKKTAKETFAKAMAEVKKEFEVDGGTGKTKPTKPSFSKTVTEAQKKAEIEDCDDDHEHVEYKSSMSDEEKRLYQLKEMLKNGLIGREEYRLLLKKHGLD